MELVNKLLILLNFYVKMLNNIGFILFTHIFKMLNKHL